MKAIASSMRNPPHLSKPRLGKPHLGKRPMKFYITCHDIHIDLRSPHGEVLLVWRRGAKVVTSKPVKVHEELDPVDGSLSVSASFAQQDMALLCTIFLDEQRSVYEPKLCEFQLKELTAGGTRRTIASTSLDLSRYASAETSRTQVEVPLPADGSVGVMRMTLVARWLRNFSRADESDSASAFSGVTDLSAAHTGAAAEPRARGPGAHGSAGSAPRLPALGGADEEDERPPSPRELERAHAERAIEDLWAQHSTDGALPGAAPRAAAGGAAAAAALEAATAENGELQAEVRRLQAALDKVGDRTKVALAERVAQLEARLVRAERERADVEERLAHAFTSVITDLELELERTRAAVGAERARAGGGGGEGARQQRPGSAGALGSSLGAKPPPLFSKLRRR